MEKHLNNVVDERVSEHPVQGDGLALHKILHSTAHEHKHDNLHRHTHTNIQNIFPISQT